MLKMNLITQKELWGGLPGELYRDLYRELYRELREELWGELYWAPGSQIRTDLSQFKISRV
jgi:hypothetical protein